MNSSILKKYAPHLIALAVIFLVMFAYFTPLFNGKALKQHDVTQWKASYEEINKFQKTSGERTFWTNSMFSGMPGYLIGATYYYNFSDKIYRTINMALGNPLETIFLLYICFYIALLVFQVNPWFAIAGALAFTFSTFNFINIDAGHAGKGNAIALIPLVIAGIRLTLGDKKLIGATLTGIALSLQLAAGHLQITYYLALIIMVWMIAELVLAFKDKTLPNLFKTGGLLLIAAGLAVCTNITNLLVTEEYGKYSIRGQSELTKTATGESNASIASTGLDYDYALQWSNGVSEPFTLLIPNFFGGANAGDPHTQDVLAKHYKSAGLQQSKELAAGLPAYFGDQPFTAGPIYYGAIICFLFVFGLFVVKGSEKWWILIISTLAIFLSMGKNFPALTDVFFYNFPLYNKFRSVTFILAITQTTFPLLAMLAIRDMITGAIKKPDLLKGLYYAGGIAGGLCLIFAMMPELASVSSDTIDEELKKYNYPLDVITEGRAKVRQMDALRSLAFIALAFATLWAFIQQKIKQEYLAAILGVLILVDLWGVDKRYLNDKDYEKKKKANEVLVEKTMADEMILQDKDIHYRVYNTTQRLDQDALTSYYHKSIGGYHGAKMRRYQDLIEFQIGKRTGPNMEVLNMLNVKYFIVGDSLNQLYPQQNPMANGNAWFIKNYVMVENADAEIDSLTNLNTKTTCIIDKRFADQVNGLTIQPDTSATIKLITYQPNKLVYESNASSEQLAVFSEIFYDKGWDAYIDGQPATYFRCNYVLRGMKVPAGKHTIEYRFEPKAVAKGETITLISSVLLYGGALAALLGMWLKNRKQNKA
ncbi:MAG: YfhO family protein [Bacteroidota bacterium]